MELEFTDVTGIIKNYRHFPGGGKGGSRLFKTISFARTLKNSIHAKNGLTKKNLVYLAKTGRARSRAGRAIRVTHCTVEKNGAGDTVGCVRAHNLVVQ